MNKLVIEDYSIERRRETIRDTFSFAQEYSGTMSIWMIKLEVFGSLEISVSPRLHFRPELSNCQGKYFLKKLKIAASFRDSIW